MRVSVPSSLTDAWRWRLRVGFLLLCLGAAIVLLAQSCAADRADRRVDRAREQRIERVTAAAVEAREETRQARIINDNWTATAQEHAAVYHAERRRVVLPTDSSAAAGTPVTPGLTERVIAIIAQADTTIPLLSAALDSARAGWALERVAGDSLLRVIDLMGQRPKPRRSWCERECGIAIGVVGTIGVLYLGAKYVLPIFNSGRRR